MVAHEFLEKLRVSHPAEYDDLREVPLSVAELIARWFVADPERALDAARDFGRGKGTVDSIRKAMKELIPRGHGGLVGGAAERAYRTKALGPLSSIVAQATESEIIASSPRQRDPASGLMVDFMFEVSSVRGLLRIAVLVVGPYTNATMYRDRSDEWIVRAFGLTWVVDRVLLAMPVRDYFPAYRDRVGAVIKASRAISGGEAAGVGPVRNPNVDVIQIGIDR